VEPEEGREDQWEEEEEEEEEEEVLHRVKEERKEVRLTGLVPSCVRTAS